ncbi:MAG: glycosyltransferase [Oscillospiraceae bacterium]|nr:glycosyltransferase [Oscillospiraceae bacterium]MDD6146902.1 glycosyltransferase [Oscillospiraceae bacterium]
MKFSIIIPVYGAEKYIRQCIDSVLCQSFRDFEVILIDDQSPDNCPKICDEYAVSDPRVQVIHQQNAGAAAARNHGIKVADGEYIMFLDSDDYWKDALALTRINDFINQFRCDVLCTNLSKVDENGNNQKSYFSPSDNINGKEAVLQSEKYISSPCIKIIRHSLFQAEELNFRQGVCSEDIDWSLRLALKADHITYVDFDFYNYRQRRNSISNSMNLKKFIDLKNNVQYCIELINSLPQNERTLYLPYVSYQYAILLFNIGCVPNVTQRRKIISELKTNAELLNYSSSRKIKLMRTVTKVGGFSTLCRMMVFFSRIRGLSFHA